MKKIILAIILSTIINPVLAADSDGTNNITEVYCVKIESVENNKADSDGTNENSNYILICQPIEKK